MMTEYTVPIDELIEFKGETFISSAPEFTEETLPRVDAVRGVFITSRNEEIELSSKPVSSLIIERLQSEGKPKIPQIEVMLLGKHKQLEYHAGHEGYQARLKEWEEEAQLKHVRYLFTVGVKGSPPQEFIDEQRPFFPTISDVEMKYLWICSRLPDEDIGAFTEAITGRTLPTTKAVEQVANFTEST
jgi:hypothetical protein